MDEKEASLARDVAEAAEEAARLAIERAQAVEISPDEFGTDRSLEQEVAQIREEANHAVELVQETEETTGETAQAIWPMSPQTIDNENDSEIC
jgi:hypothetical protein